MLEEEELELESDDELLESLFDDSLFDSVFDSLLDSPSCTLAGGAVDEPLA